MGARCWHLKKRCKLSLVPSLLWLPLLAACDPLHTSADKTLSASEVANFALLDERFVLPKGARNVRVSYAGFQDDFLWVRFEMPLDAALGFATGYVGSAKIADCTAGAFKSVGPDWWFDHCVEGAKFGKVDDSTNLPPRQIMIVPRDKMAVVYIYTSTV